MVSLSIVSIRTSSSNGKTDLQPVALGVEDGLNQARLVYIDDVWRDPDNWSVLLVQPVQLELSVARPVPVHVPQPRPSYTESGTCFIAPSQG